MIYLISRIDFENNMEACFKYARRGETGLPSKLNYLLMPRGSVFSVCKFLRFSPYFVNVFGGLEHDFLEYVNIIIEHFIAVETRL